MFTSSFWRELFRLTGVKLNLSSAFHPQSDGQSEVVNKIITMYLRCLTGDRPREWLRWLPWAEFAYNSSYQSSIQTSPFAVVYGRLPPSLRSYTAGATRLLAVDKLLGDRDTFMAEVKDRLEQAQQYHKRHYDSKHREQEYAVGQWVWLRLLHLHAASIKVQGRSKLGPKFYGPYQVVERVNDVAYRLKLPEQAQIHDVFHVGVLKPYIGEPPATVAPLPQMSQGRVIPQPEKVIKARLARGVRDLVQWKATSAGHPCGCLWRTSSHSIQNSSSRTSCLRRRGEMSW